MWGEFALSFNKHARAIEFRFRFRFRVFFKSGTGYR